MATKSISSTEAQNNFGRVLDDVTHNRARYIIERRGVSQAIVLSFEDFARVLNNEQERRAMASLIKECQPEYSLGQVIKPAGGANRER